MVRAKASGRGLRRDVRDVVDVALEHDLTDLFVRRRKGLRPAAEFVREHRAGLISSAFTIPLFFNGFCDPSGFGEGSRLMATFTVNTDGAGNASFDQVVPATFPSGHVTATATNAGQQHG